MEKLDPKFLFNVCKLCKVSRIKCPEQPRKMIMTVLVFFIGTKERKKYGAET